MRSGEDDLLTLRFEMDGTATLAGIAARAEVFAEHVRGLEAQGWTLLRPAGHGCAIAEPPQWFRDLPERLTVKTYRALPEEVRRQIEVSNGRPVIILPEPRAVQAVKAALVQAFRQAGAGSADTCPAGTHSTTPETGQDSG